LRSNSVKTPGLYGYAGVVVHRSASLASMYSFGAGLQHNLLMGIDIIVVGIVLWCVIRATPWLNRHISQTGINVVIRLMGLILLALAVEFIAGGLKGLFPALS